MKQLIAKAGVAAVLLVFLGGCEKNGMKSSSAADAVIKAGDLAFPSATMGSQGDVLAQVDEVLTRADEMLKAQGLGIGHMLQHTIYIKDGEVEPFPVLQRFHAKATELAPSLKEHPSVGTILRVPAFPDPNTLVMMDMVAGIPSRAGAVEEFRRIRFTFGPQEIAETISVGEQVFVAGTEALNFETGELAEELDAQIEAVVFKLNNALTKAGLSFDNMVTHNLYITQGANVGQVIQKYHQTVREYAPNAYDYPGVGAIAVVNGMAVPGFWLEMDAVAATGNPASYQRVPLAEVTTDVSRSVEVDGILYLSSMPGTDFADNMRTPSQVLEQVDIAVKNVQLSLERSGLSLADMVKHRLFLKIGAGDPAQVRERFYQAVRGYVPGFKEGDSAESLVIVEALASPDRLFEVQAIAARQ